MWEFIKNLLIIMIKISWRIIKFIFIILASIFIAIVFSNKMSLWLYGKNDNQIELFIAFISAILGFITSVILSNKQFKTEIYRDEIYPTYKKYEEFISKEIRILVHEDRFYLLFANYEKLIEMGKSINQDSIRDDIRLILEKNFEYIYKIFFLLCDSIKFILEYFMYYYQVPEFQTQEFEKYIIKILDINYSDFSFEQKIKYIESLECSSQKIDEEFKGTNISNFLNWLNNNYQIQELEKNLKEFYRVLQWEMRIVFINTKYAESQVRFDNFRDI